MGLKQLGEKWCHLVRWGRQVGVGEQLGSEELRALIWINDNQVNIPGKKSGSRERDSLENKFGNLSNIDGI